METKQAFSEPYPFLVMEFVMPVGKTFADHAELREIAMSILKRCGGDRKLILAVQQLMNSREDSLSHKEALRQLEELLGRCQPEGETLEVSSPDR